MFVNFDWKFKNIILLQFRMAHKSAVNKQLLITFPGGCSMRKCKEKDKCMHPRLVLKLFVDISNSTIPTVWPRPNCFESFFF